jgi:hypothetical protein
MPSSQSVYDSWSLDEDNRQARLAESYGVTVKEIVRAEWDQRLFYRGVAIAAKLRADEEALAAYNKYAHLPDTGLERFL